MNEQMEHQAMPYEMTTEAGRIAAGRRDQAEQEAKYEWRA
jgi:hypothetical protein